MPQCLMIQPSSTQGQALTMVTQHQKIKMDFMLIQSTNHSGEQLFLSQESVSTQEIRERVWKFLVQDSISNKMQLMEEILYTKTMEWLSLESLQDLLRQRRLVNVSILIMI
jgi:hypothetical protein